MNASPAPNSSCTNLYVMTPKLYVLHLNYVIATNTVEEQSGSVHYLVCEHQGTWNKCWRIATFVYPETQC